MLDEITEDCLGCPYLIEVDKEKIVGDRIYGVPPQSDTCLGIIQECYVACSFREGIDDQTETNCLCVSEFFVEYI